MAGWRPPFSLSRALPAVNVASATLGGMRTRTVIATGAWLLGAAAATAGGLLVVSELGEGITGSPSQQPTVSVINQAQASQSAQPLSSPRPPSEGGTDRTAGTDRTGGTRGAGGTGGAGGTRSDGGTGPAPPGGPGGC